MIYRNNYLAVMRRFTLINKSYIAPQIKVGRNNVTKQSTTAGKPIPLESSYTLGSKITLSSDGNYLVVGDNIKTVKITAQLHLSITDKNCGLAIRAIRNNVEGMLGCSYGDGTNYMVNTTVIADVSTGDKIFIATTTDSVINPANGGGFRSYLMVEKIA